MLVSMGDRYSMKMAFREEGVVVTRDITEIKQTQIQLENQTQLLETVF